MTEREPPAGDVALPMTVAGELAAEQADIFGLGRRVLAGDDCDALVDELLATVQRTLAPDLVTLFELLPEQRTGTVRDGRGWSAQTLAAGPLTLGEDTQGGIALRDRRPVVVDDCEAEDGCRWPAVLVEHGMRSGIALPVLGPDGVAWGLLGVHWRAPRHVEPCEVMFLDALAFVVGVALHRERAADDIRGRALHDPLTGLPNRLLFVDRLEQVLRRTAGEAAPVCVLLIALDRFRVINETLGYGAGDELLRAVTTRLRARLGATDTLARLSGDLFAVACDGVDGEREALTRAEDLTEALAAPFWVEETDVFVTATVGIAVAGDDTRDAEGLLRNADVALFRGKQHGGGHCELFGRDQRRRLVDRLRLEADLRRGVDDGQLRLAYQPIVSLEDARIVGAEALVRWEHPQRGMVSPADFIPVAEDTGLIVAIGAWVLEEACRQLVRWSARHPDSEIPYISVNVSGRQVAEGDFPGTVAAVLARTGIDPARLVLEITESVLMERTASPVAVLEDLKDLGVRVFLDDFGTGYSSLSYLKRFPIDAVKIDRSFVSGLAEGGHDVRIVEAILGIATALGHDVVAEGVETPDQVEMLLDLGCQLAQGFHFARPMSATAIDGLLRSGLELQLPARSGDRLLSRAPAAPAETPAAEPSPGETVTLGEAAQALNVSASTLRRWAESGRIEAIRTPGGHRRFSVSEVSRLNAARGSTQRRVVQPLAPPVQALDPLREMLDVSGFDLAGAATRALYGGDQSPGWFSEPDAEAPVRAWIAALASCCGRGVYGGARDSTLTLTRQAQLGGATLLERHAFVELFGEAALRALASATTERSVLAATRRLFVSLRQGLLADVA
jgi:diguanylate cyclase (GGDEF)-like protein/excisionase family DNA binding protein